MWRRLKLTIFRYKGHFLVTQYKIQIIELVLSSISQRIGGLGVVCHDVRGRRRVSGAVTRLGHDTLREKTRLASLRVISPKGPNIR